MIALRRSLTGSERALVLRWVVVTTVGWIVGFAVCENFVKPFLYTITHLVSDGAVIGIAVGIGQGLVLGRRGYGGAGWALASSLGFAIGKDVGDMVAATVSGPLGVGLAGVVIGASFGVAQWLILRGLVADARWWIPATALAWAVGWSVINVVDPETSSTGSAYLIGAIGAASAGLITGATLAWLMRRPHADQHGGASLA